MISAELRALLANRVLPHQVSTEVVDEVVSLHLSSLLRSTTNRQGCLIERSDEMRLAALSLRARHHHNKVVRDVVELAGLVSRHGVPLQLFKGLASSYSLYDQPYDRPCTDLDIYVGSWPGETRRRIFTTLGLDPRQVTAIEDLAARRRPVYEVSVPRGRLTTTVSVDAHFNPYGLLTRFRGGRTDNYWRESLIPAAIEVPTPEFALAISLLNLTRNGGGSMWYTVDATRILQGRSGPIDWDRFETICRADGLRPICAQALWSVIDGVGLDVDVAIARPRTTRHWAPKVGEGPLPLTRRGKLVSLYRSPQFMPEAALALYRWFIPCRTALDARGVALDDHRRVRRVWRALHG